MRRFWSHSFFVYLSQALPISYSVVWWKKSVSMWIRSKVYCINSLWIVGWLFGAFFMQFGYIFAAEQVVRPTKWFWQQRFGTMAYEMLENWQRNRIKSYYVNEISRTNNSCNNAKWEIVIRAKIWLCIWLAFFPLSNAISIEYKFAFLWDRTTEICRDRRQSHEISLVTCTKHFECAFQCTQPHQGRQN